MHHLSFETDKMDGYADSRASSSTSSLLESSPQATSPLTTPELSDTDDVPPAIGADGSGLLDDAASPSFILVIGGLGYIGSHTVLELLREGYNVIVVDNCSNSYESVLHNIKRLIAQHCKSTGAAVPLLHFHRVDYRSRSMRFLLESYADLVPPSPTASSPSEDAGSPDRERGGTHRSRIAGVIHFAAYKSVAESIDRPLQYYRNNVCGLVSLLQLLDQYGIHDFIFSSSATVYGTKANAGVALREEDLVHHPLTYTDELTGAEVKTEPVVAGLTCPYARTKYFGEAILADLAVADPRWRIVALRYFNPVGSDPSGVLGENPRNTPTNLYPIIAQVLTGQRESLDVFGSDWSTRDGTAIRDFIHVLDVARGHIAALRKPSTPSDDKQAAAAGTGFRAYNLGSGTGTTVLEAVRSLEDAAQKPIALNWAGRRPGDVGMCVASTARANTELGWSPRESIAQCAADLWNFVQRSTGLGSR